MKTYYNRELKEWQSEDDCIEFVNGWYSDIQYIKNPSEQIQLEAVKKNGFAIHYIKNPSKQVIITALFQNIYCLYYINEELIDEEIQNIINLLML